VVSVITEKTAIDIYLNEISKIPLLTKEEELQITNAIVFYTKKLNNIQKQLKKSSNGNKKNLLKKKEEFIKELQNYKKKMVRGNCRLVISIARKYQNININLSDLIEEGNLGLLKAIDRFDPSKGFRFSTFAIWWIKQSILKSIKDKANIIRIPIHIDKEINKFKKITNEFTKKYGYEPTLDEIVDLVDINRNKLRLLANIPKEFISINLKIGNSDKEIGDLIALS
jgi:RNA polymerase sigma factor (sigma-70 family)